MDEILMPKLGEIEGLSCFRAIMAFRDHIADALCVDTPTSCIHGVFEASKNEGHPLMIFNDIMESKGHRVAINLLTRDRLAKSMNIPASEIVDILGRAMENLSPPNLIAAEKSPVMESGQEEVDLFKLPIPWHYPEDRGRYMSSSIIIAEYDGRRNVSFHRQFVRDENHVVARLVPRHLRTMLDEANSAGVEIPIGIVNAPDPVVLLAAAMSFDEHIDELEVASSLHMELYGTPLDVVKLENGVIVPAESEYAMSATITLAVDEEGPYVDITGTVDDVRNEPVIRIDKIHHRSDPIFHALIPAQAEHRTLMGLPRAPTIKKAVNEVTECVDVYLSDGGCGWLSSVVAINPKTSQDSIKAINAALEGHKSMKQVTIVDSDIDVSNPIHVEWAMATRWQPDKDTIILSDQKGSSLDPSRSDDGLTSKVGFDATIPFGDDKKKYSSIL